MSLLAATEEIRAVTTTVSVVEFTVHVQEKSVANGVVWETGGAGTVVITTPAALYAVPASTSAIVDDISLFNTSSITQDITVYRRVGGINRTWVMFHLLEDERAHYVRGQGWTVFDSSGLVKTEATRAGTAFPGPSFDGQPFYRTDLGWDFNWDAGRSKWLGDIQDFQFGKAGSSGNGVELKFGGNQVPYGPSNRGIILPYDITVVGMTAANQTTLTGDFAFYRNTGLIAELQLSSEKYLADMTLNADAAASVSSVTSVHVTFESISDTSLDPNCVVYYRRHES